MNTDRIVMVDTNEIVTAERARLAPFVGRVGGTDMRESFWRAFDGAAERFARGGIDSAEFRAIVHELERDAVGTAAVQSRDAGAPRDVTPRPVGGSARLAAAGRVACGFAAVLVAGVVVTVARRRWLPFGG